ncbi:MAG: response regulator, partial [Lentisphaeria bacterium]|nr:response regulator [Lentisphaeria bacterium]
MENLDSILSDMISEEEQLESLVATTFGIHNGLNHMFSRLSSYHALLELELEESPTGKIYLQEGDIALRVTFELLKSLERALDVHRRDFESVDLQALVTGVSRRLKKIGQTEFALDFTHVQDRDNFVWGRLHLLQQIFFELPTVFHTDTPEETDKLHITVRAEVFTDEFFKSCKSVLEGGEYTLLLVSRQEREFDNQELVGFFEKQVISPNLELADNFISMYGTVLLHGGDMLCVKKENELQSLALLFPFRRNRVEMYGEQAVDDEMLQGTETILLVDDDKALGRLYSDMLFAKGYQVRLAENVETALENLAKATPALIVLDIMMPEIDGIEGCRRIRDA